MSADVQIRISERGGARTASTFNQLHGKVKSLKSQMLSFGASMGVGIGGAALVRSVVNVDAALTRLVIAAGKGPAAIAKLRADVRKASTATGKSAGDLVAGMARVVEITGDFDLATSSMSALGKISTATGSDIESVAATAAELGQKMGIAGGDLEHVFDILAVQGKKGSFELKNMAQEFPSLLANLAAFRVKGEGAIRTFGAFLQIARRGKGSAAETASAVNALMASLRNLATQKKLSAMGIKNVGSSNPVDTFMALIRKTKGDPTKIATALGGRHEATSAILPLATMFQQTGGFKEMEDIQNVDKLGAIGADFSTWMTSAAGQLDRAKNEIENVAIDKLTASIRGLAKHGNALVEGIQWVGDHFGGVVAGLVALKFAPSVIGGIRGLRAGSAASAAVSAAGAVSRVQPVFVVNMPGAHMGQAAGYGLGGMSQGAAATTRELKTFRSTVRDAGGVLGALGLVAQAGAAGYALGTLVDKLTGASDAFSEAAWQILHPEEYRRRAKAAADQRKNEWLGGFSKTDQQQLGGAKNMREYAKLEAVRRMKEFAANPATGRMGGDESLQNFAASAGRTGGMSAGDVAALLPELRAIVAAVQKQEVMVTMTDFLGLGRPALMQGRGPRQ